MNKFIHIKLNFRIYPQFIKASIQMYMAYRVSFIMELFNRIGLFLIQISIWNALFQHNSLEVVGGDLSLNDMITYSFLTASIGILLTNSFTSNLNGTIRSGNIAFDMIKPYSLVSKMFSEYLGTKVIQILIQFIPILLLYTLFFNDSSIHIQYVPYFILTLIGSIVLSLLISYIIGLVAIWWIDSWPLNMFFDSVMKLLSGMWIPLWIFPNWLRTISLYSPYAYIYFNPINILLGKSDVNGALQTITIQLFWIVLFIFVQRTLWYYGRRKITIQGG